MPKGSSLSESVTAMLEVPRGVVLQQGLPGSALEGTQASLSPPQEGHGEEEGRWPQEEIDRHKYIRVGRLMGDKAMGPNTTL